MEELAGMIDRLLCHAPLGTIPSFLSSAGIEDQWGDLGAVLGLYLVLLCDHGKGNASTNVGTIIDGTMANPFQCVAGAALALDGPSHGRANLDAAKFIHNLVEQYGPEPTEQSVRAFLETHIGARRKIPGMGHGLLACVDPRFTLQMELAKERKFDCPSLRYAELIGSLAPEYLKAKTNRCWPNVDLATDPVFEAAGFPDSEFLTVMFLLSRATGVGAQAVIDRMMQLPLIRPRAKTLKQLEEIARAGVPA